MPAEVTSPCSWPECMARFIVCREIRGGLLLEDLGAELYLKGWKERVEQSRQKRKLVSGTRRIFVFVFKGDLSGQSDLTTREGGEMGRQ